MKKVTTKKSLKTYQNQCTVSEVHLQKFYQKDIKNNKRHPSKEVVLDETVMVFSLKLTNFNVKLVYLKIKKMKYLVQLQKKY